MRYGEKGRGPGMGGCCGDNHTRHLCTPSTHHAEVKLTWGNPYQTWGNSAKRRPPVAAERGRRAAADPRRQRTPQCPRARRGARAGPTRAGRDASLTSSRRCWLAT